MVAALPLVPALGDSSKWMTIAILTFVVAALASSWNILGGFAGQISLGQAAFFGVGAHITRETWLGGWPLPLSLLVGTVVTMVGAAVIGVPMLRLRGIYFSIGTLAAAEALRITVGNLRPGISSLPADALATLHLRAALLPCARCRSPSPSLSPCGCAAASSAWG